MLAEHSRYFGVQTLLLICLVAFVATVSLAPTSNLAAGKRRLMAAVGHKSLQLCPPGGRSFMMAWTLACPFKRRRRSITGTIVDYKSNDKRIRDYAFNALKETFGAEAARSWLSHETRLAKRSLPMDFSKSTYRLATLSEIQRICCGVGCELRDLKGYCDPFGPYNS